MTRPPFGYPIRQPAWPIFILRKFRNLFHQIRNFARQGRGSYYQFSVMLDAYKFGMAIALYVAYRLLPNQERERRGRLSSMQREKERLVLKHRFAVTPSTV
jgi:hypothetical protein